MKVQSPCSVLQRMFPECVFSLVSSVSVCLPRLNYVNACYSYARSMFSRCAYCFPCSEPMCTQCFLRLCVRLVVYMRLWLSFMYKIPSYNGSNATANIPSHFHCVNNLEYYFISISIYNV